MAAVDPVKDALGLVMAFYRDGEAIATMRFIPTGHGITLTERWWSGYVTERALLGHQSWEVGHLVMAPEHHQDDCCPVHDHGIPADGAGRRAAHACDLPHRP